MTVEKSCTLSVLLRRPLPALIFPNVERAGGKRAGIKRANFSQFSTKQRCYFCSPFLAVLSNFGAYWARIDKSGLRIIPAASASELAALYTVAELVQKERPYNCVQGINIFRMTHPKGYSYRRSFHMYRDTTILAKSYPICEYRKVEG